LAAASIANHLGQRQRGEKPRQCFATQRCRFEKLAVLDSGFNDSFLWPTLSTVNAPKSICTTDCLSGSNTAPAGFANRIQLWCNGSMLTSFAQGPCNVSMQLKSLTFNAQPFATANASGFFKLSRNDMLSTALNAVGSSGFMSLETVLDSEGKGKLYAVGKQTSLDNPVCFLRQAATPPTAPMVWG
jgi:hypothetical protein